MEDIKTLLIPRQHVLKRIDPSNSLPVEDVRRELRSLKAQYVNIVVNGNHPEEMGVSEALDLYETWRGRTRGAPSRGHALASIALSIACAGLIS